MESTLLDSKLDAALHLTESVGLRQLSWTIDELERTTKRVRLIEVPH